jgi:hypothetical protein
MRLCDRQNFPVKFNAAGPVYGVRRAFAFDRVSGFFLVQSWGTAWDKMENGNVMSLSRQMAAQFNDRIRSPVMIGI